MIIQDASHIQSLEHKMRRELHAKGHVARYTLKDVVGHSAEMRSLVEHAELYANSHCFCNCKSACRSEVQRSAVFINKYRTIGLYICGQLPISRIRNINYYFCLILTISHSVNGLSCILFCNSVGILSDCIICDLSESKRYIRTIFRSAFL